MKKKFIDYYMKIAEITAELSYAKRLKVGSVIVKGDKILASGYNGMPAGWDNNCETKEYMSPDTGGWVEPEIVEERWPCVEYAGEFNDQPTRFALTTRPEVLHAESNAIAKMARSTESSEGAYLFCTHAPCLACAKLIHQAGIKTVYYCTPYRDTAGVDFLKLSEIDVHQYDSSV